MTLMAYHARGSGSAKLLTIKPNGYIYRCANVPDVIEFKTDEQGKIKFSTIAHCERDEHE